jgi:hypothetical protein
MEIKKRLHHNTNVIYFVSALFLMPVNWVLEAFKWQKITATLQPISLMRALASVWAGLCVGNLTPGRFGEFAGRILFFHPEHRSKISLTHFVCGMTQLLTTCVIGVLAIVIFLAQQLPEQKALWISILMACLLFTIGLIVIFFRINRVYDWVSRRKWFHRFQFGSMEYSRVLLMKLVGISIIRYAVFASQYFMLLRFCGSSIHPFLLYQGIAISFMLMSALPMISVLEVFIRAAIAVMIFGIYDSHYLLIALASSLLWLMNIILPSIFGYFIILFHRLEISVSKK